MKLILLSIHPEYSSLIFSRRKTVELRKSKMHIDTGDIVIVYETVPTKAIVGYFVIESIESGDPQVIWKKYSTAAMINKQKFEEYYFDKKNAVAIKIGFAKKFAFPMSLDVMRNRFGILPPQNFIYLSDIHIADYKKEIGMA